MQDVLGSPLERSEEGKPRKAESKAPLMVVGSKSQRWQLPVSFQKHQRKLEIWTRLCVLFPAFWKAGTPPPTNRLKCIWGASILRLLLPGDTPQNRNKAVGQSFSGTLRHSKVCQVRKLLVHLLVAPEDFRILLIGAKPVMLDRKAAPHAESQATCHHSS